MSEDAILSNFDALLSEIQGLLGSHVVAGVYQWQHVAAGDGTTDLRFLPALEAGGRLRRGEQNANTETDVIVFTIGEETPGRFARLHLSPEWFLSARWMDEDKTRQLVIESHGLVVTLVPVEHDGD